MSIEREPTGPYSGGDGRSDGELARLVADGDQAAASILIVRYERLVRSFLRKITGRPDLADDLAQDTFVRLLKNAGRFDPKYPMRTWLLTIARRLSINHSRRSDQKVMSTEYDGQHTQADGPGQKVEARDTQTATRKLLNEALKELSEPQRVAMVLFHEKEMSIEDVAAAMEMPVGTIKSHLHRARAAMRKLLGPKVEVMQS
ncbi:MAG: RNA polymerase sigma factor [Phycisphaeraceae bacterium]